MENKTAKKIHKLYEESKKMTETVSIIDGVKSVEDEAEKEFYVLLCDFFMQQIQKEVLKNEVY